MFFIIGFDRRKGGEMTVCDKSGRRYTIFYIANCLSLFFIPILNTSKVFYISLGGNNREISKEEYNQMKETGIVLTQFENMSEYSSDFRQAYESAASYSYSSDGDTAQRHDSSEGSYTGGTCPICRNPLETTFAFCPYCGQKRPRKN